MMIFIGADYGELGLSPEEIQERMQKWFTWHEKMASQDIVVSGEALKPEISTISGKDKVVTDNVAVESKELIGGFYVIKAANLDEAKVVAQDFPDYELGSSVQIQEVMEFDNF